MLMYTCTFGEDLRGAGKRYSCFMVFFNFFFFCHYHLPRLRDVSDEGPVAWASRRRAAGACARNVVHRRYRVVK